jgi:hypothetical protein
MQGRKSFRAACPEEKLQRFRISGRDNDLLKIFVADKRAPRLRSRTRE